MGVPDKQNENDKNKLNIAPTLIRLYKTFTRTYIGYTYMPLAALSKTQSQKLEVIQNVCFCYARSAADSTYISNNELRSCFNISSVEQRILASADSWWRKSSKNNDDIMNFTYHHQAKTYVRTPLNIIEGNKFI